MRHTMTAIVGAALAMFATITMAEDAKGLPQYPNMAPLEQYLMPRDQEVSLARSAAPTSISGAADVWVLTKDGYVSVATGSNGFACLVERSWSSSVEDREFWNSQLRGPICFNPAAVRYFVPLLRLRTKAVIESRSKTTLAERVREALKKGELPALPAGAMCFMMSPSGYLSDQGGHWHPHLMFFEHQTTAAAWGANLPGSAVIAFTDPLDDVTTFLVPVAHWSDGTMEMAAAH